MKNKISKDIMYFVGMVFASHSHGDHYSPVIFDWKKDLNDITYVMGFEPQIEHNYVYIEPFA